jgi:hypothetical protein
LQAVERQIGKKPKELENLIELPDALRECWFWFLALNSTRSSGFGMSPITYTEIRSFFLLKGIEPLDTEVDIIKMFDAVAMDFNAKTTKKNNNKK